jgi:hypothetical protein
MLDLATVQDAGDWDRFRPVGEDTFEQEAFVPWWARHREALSDLHRDVCEQWIFRHWRATRHRWLDPLGLVSHDETFTTDAFLAAVHLHWGGPVDAEFDYDVFRSNRPDPLPTAMDENWANGTWVLPPVLLETPDGVKFHTEEYPDKRYLVVEGSKRFRWLNALAHRSEETGPHRCYVLKPR